jgi:hypothetical protein
MGDIDRLQELTLLSEAFAKEYHGDSQEPQDMMQVIAKGIQILRLYHVRFWGGAVLC